jgi:hypothetical protein
MSKPGHASSKYLRDPGLGCPREVFHQVEKEVWYEFRVA